MYQVSDVDCTFIFLGYQRFSDPINNAYPNREKKFIEEYYEFLICYLKGDLIELLEPLELIGYLYKNGCIEPNDKDTIARIQSTKGKIAACQEMFFCARRKRRNWALLFMEAIKESQEYVKVKMDPAATRGTFKTQTSNNVFKNYSV